MFDAITKSIQRIASLSTDEMELLVERLKQIRVSKDDLLIKETQTCQSIYFINQGAFRHFTIEEDGTESTIDLFIPHEWMLEYKSFVAQKPSQNIIQATSNSELFALHITDIHALARISERFFRLGTLLESGTRNQEFQNNRLTPEQKYEKLLTIRPELLHHFPLKHIASFMGMAPETLSRIRKKISS